MKRVAAVALLLAGCGGAALGKLEPVRIDLADPRYTYLGQVREMIKSSWGYPCVSNQNTATCEHKSAEVVVWFDLLSDGRLGQVVVKETSGYAIYDDYAVTAIKLAAPFPPVPPELMAKSGSTGVRVAARFAYKVESGSSQHPR